MHSSGYFHCGRYVYVAVLSPAVVDDFKSDNICPTNPPAILAKHSSH